MKYYYLDVSLEFEKGVPNPVSTAAFFKKHVMQSMKSLFGEVGASVNIDILKYDPDIPRAILRVPEDSYVKLHSSLSLSGSYEGHTCAYRVHKTTPALITLCSDSRAYQH